MKTILVPAFLFLSMSALHAQDKYFTKEGKIDFNATSPSSPEKVEGINRSVICVEDIKTGNIQFAAIIKAFEFERSLMHEHFNENYIESDKYPKAEFSGKITNNGDVNYAKDGTYPVKVKGKLSIHGETKDVETNGTLTVKNGKISAAATFDVALSDYNVSIPSIVADKVAKTAKISVDCLLEPLKN